MARSTPAQNERGPASSTRFGPHASAHRASAGPASRSDRSAAIPPGTAHGLSSGRRGVSEIALTTTVGRPAAPSRSMADSMSAASARSPASRSRWPWANRWSTVTILPASARSPARRSSAASSGAEGQATEVPEPSRLI